MEIYLARHGETKENILKLTCGQAPGVLSEKGENQVDLLGKRLSKIQFTKIYSSDLNRTKQTTNAILKYQPKNITVEYNKLIREVNTESLDGQPFALERIIKQKQDCTYRKARTGFKSDENLFEVFYRASQVFDLLVTKFYAPNYKSGITKENYSEINDKFGLISDKDIKEMFAKGELTKKEAKEVKIENRVLIVSHGFFISEFVNNCLYRMGYSKIAETIDFRNTAIFKFVIFKPKEENDSAKIGISFEIFCDSSHLD